MIRLFVAGFPRDASAQDVLALFRQFGATEEGIIFPRDRRTRRKKGFAYIDIADPTAAENAIKTFNLFQIGDGKELTVCRAEDRPPKKFQKFRRR